MLERMLYAEDLSEGLEFAFSSYTVSEAEILEFAGRFDPLPIHADPDAARDGPFGEVIASGLHTMAIYQRLAVEALWSRVVGKAGRGFELRFRRPVPPGTTLTGKARVQEVDRRPERGDAILTIVSQLVDAEQRPVLDVTADAVIMLRAGASRPQGAAR